MDTGDGFNAQVSSTNNGFSIKAQPLCNINENI